MENISFAVNGTLMRGLALNQNLLDARAEFVYASKTSTNYRLWSINDLYPAMQRDEHTGGKIELEIWEISAESLVEIVKKEPPGLTLGRIELEDGNWVLGILGESYLCLDGKEITQWGGWRNYKEQT